MALKNPGGLGDAIAMPKTPGVSKFGEAAEFNEAAGTGDFFQVALLQTSGSARAYYRAVITFGV